MSTVTWCPNCGEHEGFVDRVTVTVGDATITLSLSQGRLCTECVRNVKTVFSQVLGRLADAAAEVADIDDEQ